MRASTSRGPSPRLSAAGDSPGTESRRSSSAARHASGARRIRRPWAAGAALGGAAALCIGIAGLAWASHTARPAAPAGRTPLVALPRGHWAAVPEPAAAPPVARPVSLQIPAIGVRTALVRLGLTAAGTLQVPATAAVAGWYTGSPRPGAIGAAVIAGHIDSVSGPGVFFRLRLLRPGDLVYVHRADGTLAVFQVTAVRSYLKARFPTSEVYGAVPNAQLRLITCGGTFDQATGHYLSNIIVFATLRAASAAAARA
jgi:sortase (surface protein transpeptidase)